MFKEATSPTVFGDKHVVFLDVTLDDAYPAGGYSMEGFGLDIINYAAVETKSGYIPKVDYANKKLMVFYADYDAVADGALIEVPNGADLSAVTVRVMAIGV